MEQERISTLRTVISRSGKPLYYESDNSFQREYWRRIGKEYFDYYVKEYEKYAIELQRDQKGKVSYIKFKHNTDRLWAEMGLKRTRKEYVEDGKRVVHLGFEKIEKLETKVSQPKGCFAHTVVILLLVIGLIVLMNYG